MFFFPKRREILEKSRVTDIYFYSFVEDPPSCEVAKKIISYSNESMSCSLKFKEGFPKIEGGYGSIKKKMPSLIKMANKGICSFVITDLDSANCPPSLISDWLGGKKTKNLNLPKGLFFRIAVREVESWLIADRDSFASFLGIPNSNFTAKPDELKDPKQKLLNIIRSKGRKAWHKEMLPQSSCASIGPKYNQKICEFVRKYWCPERASMASQSLKRAIVAFKKWDLENGDSI